MAYYLKNYLWLVILVAVIFCDYFIARIITNYIAFKFDRPQLALATASQPEIASLFEVDDKSIDTDVVVKRNLFDTEISQKKPKPLPQDDPVVSETPDPVKREGPKVDPLKTKPIKTSLDLELISTFSIGNGQDKRSSAVVQNTKERNQNVYRFGEKMPLANPGKITKIANRRVEFIHNGHLEYVAIEEIFSSKKKTTSARASRRPDRRISRRSERTPVKKEESSSQGVTKVDDNSFVISKDELERQLRDLQALMRDMRVSIAKENGEMIGWMIRSIRPQSVLNTLGIKRGDIILKINGEMPTIANGPRMLQALSSQTKFEIDVKRKSKEVKFSYEIQ